MAEDRWKAKRDAALRIARPHWGDPNSKLSVAEIAEQANCSMRLLYNELGPRSRAKERQRRRNARKPK